MNHAMPDRIDFVNVAYNAAPGIGQHGKDFLKCGSMVGRIKLDLLFLTVGLMRQDRPPGADSFGQTLGQHPFAVHFKELVLE
jgi:hypothetical protein